MAQGKTQKSLTKIAQATSTKTEQNQFVFNNTWKIIKLYIVPKEK